ncbi:MAG: adenine nucleotide alpha hydrolase [Gammaproteobacteria bacterium]|nr:adenine nucleotide alpha hydrolase [Gammaproteobacteria bacterium]
MSLLLEKLEAVLLDCSPAAAAVSGGVDSMTLAFVARRVLADQVTIYHAISPAVPSMATQRVKAYSQVQGWSLTTFNAGEFQDEQYVANPANRCFFCKTNLYDSIFEQIIVNAKAPNVQILSGTNLDDLSDYRPGLKAAEKYAVRHPFVEAGIDKAGVRALAHEFGLNDIAELPAAPCLSSRVETGIPIEKDKLHFIDKAEIMLREAITSPTVRCRIRKSGVVIETDLDEYTGLSTQQQSDLSSEIGVLAEQYGVSGAISFEQYQRGSAFLRDE